MKWGWHVFTLEIRKIFSYRVDFWTQFFSHTIIWLTISYFLWASIFEFKKIESIGGYSFHSLMLYYLFAGSITKIIMGEGIGAISREIYQGELTRYLIYPVSFFVYKLICHLAHTTVLLMQLFCAFMVFLFIFGFPQEIEITVSSTFIYLGLMILSSYLYFSIAAIFELLSFWVDNVWSLLVMLRFINLILGGALVPIVLFPEWIQKILYYLPFSHMLYSNIQIFINKATTIEIVQGVFILLLWSLIFNIIFVFLWRKGLKQYTGVGI